MLRQKKGALDRAQPRRLYCFLAGKRRLSMKRILLIIVTGLATLAGACTTTTDPYGYGPYYGPSQSYAYPAGYYNRPYYRAPYGYGPSYYGAPAYYGAPGSGASITFNLPMGGVP
jgi:hypothetical protein